MSRHTLKRLVRAGKKNKTPASADKTKKAATPPAATKKNAATPTSADKAKKAAPAPAPPAKKAPSPPPAAAKRAAAPPAAETTKKTATSSSAAPTRKTAPAAAAATKKETEDRKKEANRAPRETESPAPPPAPPEAPFPIVGIGASAGGLEALEAFLRNVPKKVGMAFVVIQHLDPTHKGAMVELLRRNSPLRVVEAEDMQKVEPDCVYVTPANKDMSLQHGVLHLHPQTSPRGQNLPIDFFFRSLAADRQEASIGVVLSGMGSDGTLGLRAIKEKAGAAFAQSLASAKFDGMPRSVMDAGVADVVADVEELPARILAYAKRAPYVAKPELDIDERQQSTLEKVLVLLRAQSGNDFSLYKRSTVQRRIERRMGLHQIDKIDNYVGFLREHPEEAELLFKELLIGVTNFFRDPEAWDYLRKEILPELLRARERGGTVRAWVPACSTGEEAYSLAIVLSEALDETKNAKNRSFQIFATDLDKDAVARARTGVYPANIAADVSPERLSRFFLKDEQGYRVRREIRDRVAFAPQNTITDPPFTKLDILSCRNFLIYLSGDVQRKLIPLFHYALNPGGILFLGSAETVGAYSGLFSAYEGKSRLYRRLETAEGAPSVEFPSSYQSREPRIDEHEHEHEHEGHERAKGASPANLQTLADRVIVQRFAPASVLTSDKGDILYLSGRTGRYLEPPVGRATLNIFGMAREGLRFELPGAFSAALKRDQPVCVRGVRVRTNGSTETIDLTVQRLVEPKELQGTVMVVMAAVPTAAEGPATKTQTVPTNRRIAELQKELEHARDEAQSTREAMQTSQEELKSTNEELQSTNEELQSSNEELTTSKEEMQSMNEELQTVNHELQSKVDDLARSNNDMRNLLNSTDVATLFLDSDLRIRRFTRQTTKIIKLIPSDTGRPITDISTELDYPDLAENAREVLQTLAFKEKQVRSRDGRWFSVRIMPYRTLENVIEGLVITFSDSTASKMLEATLREQASHLRQLTDSLPNLVWGARPDGWCDYLSQQWVEYTGFGEQEQLGYRWFDRVHPEDRERVRAEWKTAVKDIVPLNTEFRIRAKDGTYRWFVTRSAPIRDERGAVVKWYGTNTDVNDLKHASSARDAASAKLASILKWVSDPVLVLDEHFSIVYANEAAETLFRWRAKDVSGKSLFDVLHEADGTEFAETLRRAHRQQSVLRATLTLTAAPAKGSFGVLIQPEAGEVTLLFKQERGAVDEQGGR